jgi:predicted ribosome quality control (RQC) complex YloA/Tae2 family protein
VPRHPFLERAVARLSTTVGVGRTSSKEAGKDFLQKVLADEPQGVTIFPPDTFYYEPSFEPPKRPHDFPHVYAVHHSLAVYVSCLPAGTFDHRLDKFAREVARMQALIGGDASIELQERLQRTERRLRNAFAQHDQWYRAHLRQIEAEREQAAARIREMTERLARVERAGRMASDGE